jgi:hypothetical protein
MIPGPSWGRRYRSQHIRSCARPGCASPAAVTLRFQPTQREAFLVDLDERRAHSEGDLCARHAASLALPRGWALVDERTDVFGVRPQRRPELVVVPAPPAPQPEPEPEVDVEVDVDVEPEPSVLEVKATPQEIARDALGDLLEPRTPLLRRAFQNVMPVEDQ